MSILQTVYVLYYREGCHLCEDMINVLMPILKEYPHAELELRDVDRHPESKKLYDHRIPVLVYNDDVLCEYFLDPDKLRQHLNGQQG